MLEYNVCTEKEAKRESEEYYESYSHLRMWKLWKYKNKISINVFPLNVKDEMFTLTKQTGGNRTSAEWNNVNSKTTEN